MLLLTGIYLHGQTAGNIDPETLVFFLPDTPGCCLRPCNRLYRNFQQGCNESSGITLSALRQIALGQYFGQPRDASKAIHDA
jgi:hypothetical protein